ncbi:DUF6639 family protein [Marimonas lutisalis]|uniref:DUF6639 family protein n=1 Tax=Marimonas lutisalis TaxID=2545756 RepID=UPI002E2551C5
MLPLWSLPAAGDTVRLRCGNAEVSVSGADSREQALICDAAKGAAEFLGTLGLTRAGAVEIEVVDQIPEGLKLASGCYDWRVDVVSILGAENCAAMWGGKEFFRVPYERDIYKSFAAHEVAHAIAAANFEGFMPTVTTQEYIAAVTQLGTMEAALRNRILAEFEGDGFDEASEISLLYYQIDPARFIVECYRHYAKHENGPEFIRRLMRGDTVLSDGQIYLQ